MFLAISFTIFAVLSTVWAFWATYMIVQTAKQHNKLVDTLKSDVMKMMMATSIGPAELPEKEDQH